MGESRPPAAIHGQIDFTRHSSSTRRNSGPILSALSSLAGWRWAGLIKKEEKWENNNEPTNIIPHPLVPVSASTPLGFIILITIIIVVISIPDRGHITLHRRRRGKTWCCGNSWTHHHHHPALNPLSLSELTDLQAIEWAGRRRRWLCHYLAKQV